VEFENLSDDSGSYSIHGGGREGEGNGGNGILEVVYTEFVPWFFEVYLGSVRVVSEGGEEEATYKIHTYTPSPHPPASYQSLSSEGSLENRPATHLSLLLSLPVRGKTVLTMEVQFAFLRYTSFVPDAQRGVEVPGGVVRVLSSSSRHSLSNSSMDSSSLEVIRLHTPPLLISLPTPDFSMPYNVIVMTSTVMAFMFANTFNMLVRKCVWVREG